MKSEEEMSHVQKGPTQRTDKEKEQEELFLQLQNFSSQDKNNKVSEYLKIRNQLIVNNMNLAKWVLKRIEILKIPVSQKDKEQMAMLGLIDAVDKFDPSLGYQFSTFACITIIRRIKRECIRAGGVRHSLTTEEQLKRLAEIENQIEMHSHREPEPYEIAEIMDISEKRVSELQTLRRIKKKESLEQLEEDKEKIETIANKLQDDEKIIQTDVNYMKDGVYMDEEDILPVGFRKVDRIENQAIYNALKGSIEKVLDTLPTQESEYLRLKFGFS